jgi:polyphenol oxidase
MYIDDKMITTNLKQMKNNSSGINSLGIRFFPFYKQNKPLFENDAPMCFITTRECGSMRFRWNEENINRNRVLNLIQKDCDLSHSVFASVEQIHSQKVISIHNISDCDKIQADGIVTDNKKIIPVVTVADCMPIYIYDFKLKVFSVLHSGWKGTGIINNALKIFIEQYNSSVENICAVIGPHIHKCCYIVDEERADYFIRNFGDNCVEELEENGKCYCGGKGLIVEWNNGNKKLFRLSLKNANINLLEQNGILSENIAIYDDCTCCDEMFGSNRRESSENQFSSFTVMATGIINKV